MHKHISGVTRFKPEEIIITWMLKKDIPRSWHACDLCNGDLDWEPFPAVYYPSEEELADPQFVPEGSWALCKRCAAKIYDLEPQDRHKVTRIWYCDDLLAREY